MKKLLTLLGILISLSSFGQITVSQSVTPAPPYKVGDTLTVKYNVNRGTSLPRYFWLRYSSRRFLNPKVKGLDPAKLPIMILLFISPIRTDFP